MTIIIHPLNAADRAAMATLRRQLAPLKGTIGGPDSRVLFDAVMEHTPKASGVRFEEATLNAVPGWWCLPDGAPVGTAILYLHGGGYVVGSARAYRHFVSQLAVRTGVATFVADYRLAPEHRFPAALDDVLLAFRGMAEAGCERIALAGDSAGGGLALSMLPMLRNNYRAPTGAAVVSPWTDLTLAGASIDERADADPLSTRDSLAQSAALYCLKEDLSDPRASPLYGDLAGLPPIQLHVGEDDILLDDTRRYAARLTAAGGNAEAHIWAGMPHVFAANVDALTAAPKALDLMAGFLRRILQTPS